MWQYTSSGTVNGISGRVDLNIAYFKLTNEQLLSLKKLEDMDVNWFINGILKNQQGSQDDNVKASRIIDKLLKADRIARRITSL